MSYIFQGDLVRNPFSVRSQVALTSFKALMAHGKRIGKKIYRAPGQMIRAIDEWAKETPEEEADVKPEAEPKAEEEPASRLAYFHDPLIAIHASPDLRGITLSRITRSKCRLSSSASACAASTSTSRP